MSINTKRIVSLMVILLLLFSIVGNSVEASGRWGYATSTASLSSSGNAAASGSASTSTSSEITRIISTSSSNGTMSASYSGTTISASWSGGIATVTAEDREYSENSSTYCGQKASTCNWSKSFSPPAGAKDVQIRGSITSGSVSISGNTIYYSGSGATPTKGPEYDQTVSATIYTPGSTTQSTAGYGTTADGFRLLSSGRNQYASSSSHNCSSSQAWTSVTAGSNASASVWDPRGANSYTTCIYWNNFHVYYGSGTMTYKLHQVTTVYNYSGTVHYEYRYWIPNSPPNVILSNNAPNPLYRGVTVTFTGSATDSDGYITSRSWGGIASGTSSSSSTATYTPTSLGTFTASYSATDDVGATTTRQSTITVVNRPPSVTASNNAPNPLHRGTVVTLTGTANDLDGTIASTSWSGAVSGSGYSRTFTPTALGTYTATFRATDNDGGTATASTSFTVVNSPPTVTIISPLGTVSNPAVVPGFSTNIQWNYTDLENDPQTSYRVRVWNSNGTLFRDSGVVNSAANTYSLTGLSPGSLYYFNVIVTDQYDSRTSTTSYFRAGENFAVNDIITRQPVELVSKNPDVSMFIAGKHGPNNFPVDVLVQKTIGVGSNVVSITLTRTAYGKTWSQTRNVNVGTSQQTVTFTVPNVTTQDIRDWQKDNNHRNTVYDSFRFTATLVYSGIEIDETDNTKTAQFRSAEFGRSQLTR